MARRAPPHLALLFYGLLSSFFLVMLFCGCDCLMALACQQLLCQVRLFFIVWFSSSSISQTDRLFGFLKLINSC